MDQRRKEEKPSLQELHELSRSLRADSRRFQELVRQVRERRANMVPRIGLDDHLLPGPDSSSQDR